MAKSQELSEPREWFWEKLDQYLAKQGLKQTQQRRTILEFFLNLNTHVTAEELHEKLRGDDQTIGLATVYRTLSLLKDAGLVDHKQFGDGKSVWEVREPNRHHDHLICLGCGLVIEFENEEIEALQKLVAQKHGFSLTSHNLDLYGQCGSCRKNASM